MEAPLIYDRNSGISENIAHTKPGRENDASAEDVQPAFKVDGEVQELTTLIVDDNAINQKVYMSRSKYSHMIYSD